MTRTAPNGPDVRLSWEAWALMYGSDYQSPPQPRRSWLHRLRARLAWWIMPVALLLASCATPYPALRAAAQSGHAAIATFEAYDRDHKRALLAAHPECRTAPMPEACYQAVLAPYLVERDAVLRRIDALAPALTEAAKVARQADADRKLTDALTARLLSLGAAVMQAVTVLRGAP